MPSSEADSPQCEKKICTYELSCEKSATNYCRECRQRHCVEHYSQHLMKTQTDLTKQLTNLLSQLSANEILDLIKRICQLKIESDENGEAIHVLQKQLQMLIEEGEDEIIDVQNNINKPMEFDRQNSVEDDIQRLRKDIGEVETILAQIDDYSEEKASEDEMNNLPNSEEQSLSQPVIEQLDDTIVFFEEDFDDSDLPSKITQKVQLSNNIVRWLRGPVKLAFNGTLHIFDILAQGTHINRSVIQAVKNNYEKNKQLPLKSTKQSCKPAFAEITSDWIFISANPDEGFNSPSIWMRNPQGQRILVKTQAHSLCAVNEWLAYVLGKQLDLPVNEVQISIHQNNLVTLHTDVANGDEKTVTFMELRKQTRKNLLTNPIMGCMDLFDHLIQNVDRNQRNILITMPSTTKSIDEDSGKMKIHLIDHASCFGMGKLSVISLIACKFHTNHLSIVKFDPIEEAKKFERYLNRLPVHDRKLLRKTLQRFAAISNEQFDSWINEVRDLLSSSQYNRIRDVLIRQRDIAKHYSTQWSIIQVKSNHLVPSIVTYF